MNDQESKHDNPDDARQSYGSGAVNRESAPPASQEVNAPYSEAPVEYAGFWLRLVAWIIDAILLGIFSWSLKFGLGDGTFVSFGPGALVGWLYFALMESSSHQGTIGKIAVGIKVIDINGKRVSFLRATGRHFAKIISWIILAIGFIMIAFTSKKQGLHDMLADCLVVKR